jgi:hypothetical protein
VLKNGLSRMRGDSHVRFLGGGGAAMRCCYPTRYTESMREGVAVAHADPGFDLVGGRPAPRIAFLGRALDYPSFAVHDEVKKLIGV